MYQVQIMYVNCQEMINILSRLQRDSNMRACISISRVTTLNEFNGFGAGLKLWWVVELLIRDKRLRWFVYYRKFHQLGVDSIPE